MKNPTPPPSDAPKRSRIASGLAVFLVILAGLASRKFNVFPEQLGKYPGDLLWALMVYFIIGWIWPKLSIPRTAVAAAGFSVGIEFCKLISVPWLVHARQSTIGGLIFGHVFSWQNLIAYALGIALGAAAETIMSRRKKA